jgi:hypothetical protein
VTDQVPAPTAQELREETARELIENRAERRRAEEALQIARDELVGMLATGRAAGVDVTSMARWAGVSRNKAHRLLREGQALPRVDDDAPDPATGMTLAVALELAVLLDKPEALREAWVMTLATYGPTPTPVQTREVVNLGTELFGW